MPSHDVAIGLVDGQVFITSHLSYMQQIAHDPKMELIDLPIEILEHICLFLASSTLHKISLVDKSCRLAAVPALFQAISIEPRQAAQFQQSLQQAGYLKHVRNIEIKSELPSTIGYDRETFPNPWFLERFRADAQRSWDVRAQDSSWQPVAELLETLPALTDLIWTCPQQLPPCLLRSLHQIKHLGSCRLHLRTFGLRSFVKGFEETADPHELALVQSPNLYSIWFSYNIADAWNNKCHMPEAVSRTIQGLAPNLREVRLWENWMGAEPDYSDYAHMVRPLECDTSELSHVQGNLERLQFAGVPQCLTDTKVEAWSRCTDFSAAKKLMLDCYLQPPVLSTLAGCRFSSLALLTLKLTIESHESDYLRAPPDKSSRPARDFLCSIPPLRALKLSGEMDYHLLREVLVHHGKRLYALNIEPVGYSPSRLSLPPEEVAWIANQCLVLETLRLTMHRSKGDQSERAAYASIGKIGTLQSLALTIDASDYLLMRGIGHKSEGYLADPKADFDDFGREDAHMGEVYASDYDPRKGHLIDMFVNAALDERLAKAIYQIISENKPNRFIPLDTVELLSDGCGDFGISRIPPEVTMVANEIQRKWLFQRTYGSASPSGTFEVSELEQPNCLATREASTARASSLMGYKDTMIEEDDLDVRIESIFRSLWPANAHTSSWRSDWYGIGLST